MELHTKQLQIGVNSSVAAQLWALPKMQAIQLANRSDIAKQKKSLCSGTVAHMKDII